MTEFTITYRAELPAGAQCLVPSGMACPHGTCTHVECATGTGQALAEAHTGQRAVLTAPQAGHIALTFHFDTAVTAPYPEAMFTPRMSRFTRFADDLVAEVGAIAPEAAPLDRVRAIACETAERFTYGHPEATFNEGLEEIPALGCGMVEGSCVDINTYFIACLRAAGFEAGYATGFFFPAEKGDHCNDGHCWVVTRVGGVVQEWDIAHHIKMGTREIQAGLNPKPGFRAGCFHSMGLAFPELGITDLKALIEPFAIYEGDLHPFEAPDIRLHHPAISAAIA